MQRFFKRNRLIVAGGVVGTLVVLIALVSLAYTPYNPVQMAPLDRLQAPSALHPMGTDEVGRDVLSRVMAGTRISLLVGVGTVVIATVAGTFFGLLAGYFRRLDSVIMRVMDGLAALPDLLLAIVLMAILGPTVVNIMLALGIVYTPRFARVVRSSVLVVRETEYVQAAWALGAPQTRLLFRHVLPNSLTPLTVQATFTLALAILGEASLTFLGVGLPPYVPSWGTILSGGREYLTIAPWVTIFPGLAIVVTVLAFNLLGDGLRDLIDPRLRNL